jgi:hypothetical protein
MRRARVAAALVCALLGAIGALWVSRADTWGWDESMHAELPAARLLLAVEAGQPARAAQALLDSQQYPFVYPIVLALAQAPFGLSERTCRVVGRLVWALGVFGVFLLAQELARRRARKIGDSHVDEWTPWIALALAAASPLALAYSGTLFLELPFATAAVFAVRAWVRREPCSDGRVWLRRELSAGAWLVAAFFTKFNYALLLWLGIAADSLIEGAFALRRGQAKLWAKRTAAVLAIPALALLWWFVLPLPESWARAELHRRAFADFLVGNQHLTPLGFAVRLVDWATALHFSPRVLFAVLVGALCSLPAIRESGARAVWLVLLAFVLPIALHPFHLDRFLLPGAVFLWILSAVGWSRILPAPPLRRAAVLAVLALAIFTAPAVDGEWLADQCAPLSQPTPELVAYRRAVLAEKRDLSPSRRLPTAGLARTEADALLDLLAREVGPAERVAWIGGNDKLSPAALHIGLLARGGDRERLLRDAHQPMILSVEGIDPEWSEAKLLAFARGFDVVIATEPSDIGGRALWNFMARYRGMLAQHPEWRERQIGAVELSRVLRPPEELRVFALRPRR